MFLHIGRAYFDNTTETQLDHFNMLNHYSSSMYVADSLKGQRKYFIYDKQLCILVRVSSLLPHIFCHIFGAGECFDSRSFLRVHHVLVVLEEHHW